MCADAERALALRHATLETGSAQLIMTGLQVTHAIVCAYEHGRRAFAERTCSAGRRVGYLPSGAVKGTAAHRSASGHGADGTGMGSLEQGGGGSGSGRAQRAGPNRQATATKAGSTRPRAAGMLSTLPKQPATEYILY